MGDSPDFVKLAEAFGATGLRATEVGEVDHILRQGLNATGPVVMDFQVDQEENCYPMIPAGAAINEMVFSDPDKSSKKGKGQKIEEKADGVLTA